MYDLVCLNGHESLDVLVPYGLRGPCPTCGAPTENLWRSATAVIADSIPGGVEIRHGICNDDGTPKRYYHKSEITRAAKEKGLYQGGGDTYKPNVHRAYSTWQR